MYKDSLLKSNTKRKAELVEYLHERHDLTSADFRFSQFEPEMYIGHGGFGIVKMVKHKKTEKSFAMKCVKIKRMSEEDREAMRRERDLLMRIEHPFILKLVTSFVGEGYVYILTEIISGGDLLDAIDMLGILDRQAAQFYVGSIVVSLEYLHRKFIVYRDLKPENIMLSRDGYMKLIDFGLAKDVSKNDNKTMTLVGTPHFMAPEVLLGEGYGLAADMWSLGVCMFELVAGELPFGQDEDDDQAKLFKQILCRNPVLPADIDDDAADLVLRWLLKDPDARWSSNGSAAQGHSFFYDFSWSELASRRIQPPLVYTQDRFSEQEPLDPELEEKMNRGPEPEPWKDQF
jgi:cGMP-dependent protein kinase